MASPNTITASQLARLIGTPDCPTLIDVCIPEDFALDPRLIPGSRQHSHKDITGLVASLEAQRAIVICQKGLKLSAGTAALLRSHGVHAEKLEGGQVGWVRANLPTIKGTVLPRISGTRWVTRHRPKIDRIACPWLIRRFVDPAAEFLFVAPGDVDGVAEKFDAIPFDTDGGFWSHRGEGCTFDTMLTEFGLNAPALDTMATVIRAADTNRHNLAPQAAGLLALSVGLSRQYKDDLAQLNAAMPLYDALYRWARDGQDESHDWEGRT